MQDQNHDELVWSDFRRAMLASNLVDPSGFQTLIDQHRSLSQGQRSILDYVRYATTLRQKAFSAPGPRMRRPPASRQGGAHRGS